MILSNWGFVLVLGSSEKTSADDHLAVHHTAWNDNLAWSIALLLRFLSEEVPFNQGLVN